MTAACCPCCWPGTQQNKQPKHTHTHTCVHPAVVFLEPHCCDIALVALVQEGLLWAVAVDIKQLDVAVACCCYQLLVTCDFQLVDLRKGFGCVWAHTQGQGGVSACAFAALFLRLLQSRCQPAELKRLVDYEAQPTGEHLVWEKRSLAVTSQLT